MVFKIFLNLFSYALKIPKYDYFINYIRLGKIFGNVINKWPSLNWNHGFWNIICKWSSPRPTASCQDYGFQCYLYDLCFLLLAPGPPNFFGSFLLSSPLRRCLS